MFRSKNRWIRLLAATLSIAVVLSGTWFMSRKPVKAVGRDFLSYSPAPGDIEDAKRERDEARQKAEEAASQVEQLKGEKADLSGELEELQGLSDEQMAQYEEISEDLAAALIAKQDALDEYVQSQENLIAKRKQYAERISVMFEYENKSTLEILLESDSIAGFFTNLELISMIGEADLQMVDELTIAMDDAELKNERCLKEAEDMQAIADQKEAELKELRDRIGVTEEALEETSSKLSRWEQEEREFQEEADRLDEEIRRLQQEEEERQRKAAALTQAAQQTQAAKEESSSSTATKAPTKAPSKPSQPAPKGKMTWPYPGDYTVYSPYGMRYHPIYHYDKMHWGVDLGGDYGNPIVAAASGTVIKVEEPVEGQNTGGSNYGNHCVIDHGNGITTCYAHCRDVYVSVGDHVEAGQVIAECGSTGASTGPHLHFEVRENGTKVDPVPYIKG